MPAVRNNQINGWFYSPSEKELQKKHLELQVGLAAASVDNDDIKTIKAQLELINHKLNLIAVRMGAFDERFI